MSQRRLCGRGWTNGKPRCASLARHRRTSPPLEMGCPQPHVRGVETCELSSCLFTRRCFAALQPRQPSDQENVEHRRLNVERRRNSAFDVGSSTFVRSRGFACRNRSISGDGLSVPLRRHSNLPVSFFVGATHGQVGKPAPRRGGDQSPHSRDEPRRLIRRERESKNMSSFNDRTREAPSGPPGIVIPTGATLRPYDAAWSPLNPQLRPMVSIFRNHFGNSCNFEL